MQIPPYEDKFVNVNGIQLHYVEKGSGPILLFIHGFPENWYMWKHQIDFFAKQGYKCIGLDLRGCNLSEKPHGKHQYAPEIIATDIAEFIQEIAGGRATIVTAGIGGIFSIVTALQYPDKVDRLVCINAPHISAFAECFWSAANLNKTWYILLHQLPIVPELFWRMGIHYYFARFGKAGLSKQDREILQQNVTIPKVLTSILHYYRSIGIFAGLKKWRHGDFVVSQPSLNMYSKNHPAANKRTIQKSQKMFKNSQLVQYDGACMLQWTQAETINTRMLKFLESTQTEA